MKRSPLIGYGGGGGGGSHTPVEAPDSLASIQYAEIIDLVSEGEIEGFADPAHPERCIYLDGVVFENADGTRNFENVEYAWRPGTQNQDPMHAIGPQAEIAVGAEVKASPPITRTITDANVTHARITLGFPALFSQTDEGDINGTDVNIAIDVQANGGGFVEKVNDVISGKTSARYQRAYRLELEGSAPWDIRVRRITADSTSSKIQNKTWWDSYTEMLTTRLRYPNSAMVGLRVDARQFNSIPVRGYDFKLLRVQLPVNYNPVTRAYSGAWNGLFNIAWTDNPAWCFYDLMINPRYGLGEYVGDADKWALYQIGKYCDELVPDGFGGQEPRFTCNLYLQTRAEAYRVLSDFAAIFRGLTYWGTGTVGFAQDAPSDPVALYTAANVINGEFRYSGSALKTRHTVALVAWNDPSDLYRQKIEYVEDEDGIARYGVLQTEVVAVGCTSRGQARRVGLWLLASERLETETAQFRTGLDGATRRPGQLVRIADPARAGVRLGGRVKTSATGSVILDAPVTIDNAISYQLAIVNDAGIAEERTVATGAGTTDTLAVSPPFSINPPPGAVWLLRSDLVNALLYRVLAVQEPEPNQYEITALLHEPGKYALVEQGVQFQPTRVTALTLAPAAPAGIVLAESLYESAAEVRVRLAISWTAQRDAARYRVSYRQAPGNWATLPETGNNYAEALDIKPGFYEVKIIAINVLGNTSIASYDSLQVAGKTAPPATVTGLAMAALNNQAYLTWDLHPDLDVRVDGEIVVRRSSATGGATWDSAIEIARFPGAATAGFAPLLSGTYLARALDSSGNLSVADAVLVTDAPGIINMNFIQSLPQDPGFAGTKTNTVVASGILKLIGGALVDDFPLADSIGDWDSEGGLATDGSYVFLETLDLGAVYVSRVTAAIDAIAVNVDAYVDSFPDIDGLASFDGTLLGTTSARLYVRTTPDDPAGSPTWSVWQPFVIGDYKTRGFQFRLDLASSNSRHNIHVSGLSVDIDMPDRFDWGNDVSVSSGGLTITFSPPFQVSPALSITGQGMASGDYYALTSKSATGFTIQFKNSGDTGVARTMDWKARAY